MSGLSRMGQNCFGVGTPILSPLPPAGNTAATAGARRRGWASAPVGFSEEDAAARSAPRESPRRGPGAAGAGSMAAGCAAGLACPGPKRPAAAPAHGGDPGNGRRADGAYQSREGRAAACPPGRSRRGAAACGVHGLCTEPSAPGRPEFRAASLLWRAGRSPQVEASALPAYLRVPLSLTAVRRL